jgi:tRNA U34 5-methylaminomethyl-2-thiouridine-forming methyltransferase MnmC
MKLENYEELVTEDGSTTLFSKTYQEACHSKSGAINETILHYIDGCRIKEVPQKYKSINIIEVGFGTGIGFKETLTGLNEESRKFNFVSFEIDCDLIEYFLNNNQYEYSKNQHFYHVVAPRFDLKVFHGNARQSVKHLIASSPIKFNAIYQDAFSPKRNSILWTTEWFKDLLSLANEDCIMSTYSASSSIRKSMVAANWKVYKGEKFGTKRTSTRARVQGETDVDIVLRLERSPAIEITDDNYQSYKLEK